MQHNVFTYPELLNKLCLQTLKLYASRTTQQLQASVSIKKLIVKIITKRKTRLRRTKSPFELFKELAEIKTRKIYFVRFKQNK